MFKDRKEAGRLLSGKLGKYKNNNLVVILSIPRGGIIVGNQIADILHLSLGVIVVKKIRAEYNPELAIGAVTSSGIKVIDRDLIKRLGIKTEYLNDEIKIRQKAAEDMQEKFGMKSEASRISGKEAIILVDDGVATGSTVFAAIKHIRSIIGNHNSFSNYASGKQPTIILAVPVIAKDTYDRLKSRVEKIIALEIPDFFGAVGEFYQEFGQVSDEEMIKLLSDNIKHRT